MFADGAYDNRVHRFDEEKRQIRLRRYLYEVDIATYTLSLSTGWTVGHSWFIHTSES